jgi:hypothetical protein
MRLLRQVVELLRLVGGWIFAVIFVVLVLTFSVSGILFCSMQLWPIFVPVVSALSFLGFRPSPNVAVDFEVKCLFVWLISGGVIFVIACLSPKKGKLHP